MKSFNYVVTDEIGIHARPAGFLVKEAKQYEETIMIVFQGKSVDAKKVMAVMALGVAQGMEVTVTIEGENEEVVAKKMETFFKENI